MKQKKTKQVNVNLPKEAEDDMTFLKDHEVNVPELLRQAMIEKLRAARLKFEREAG